MHVSRLSLTLVLVAGLVATAAIAEEKPKAAIALLPVARDLGTFGLEYEAPVAGLGIFVSPSLRNPLRNAPLLLGLDLGARFYPFAPSPRGFFVGPHLGAGYLNDVADGSLGATVDIRFGAMIGFTLVVGDVFFLSAGVGGEYFNEKVLRSGGAIEQGGEDLRTVLRGALGLAF
jgi:hypothetical protein